MLAGVPSVRYPELPVPWQMMDNFETARQRMVAEQLLPRGISDPRVLEAMASVPRHEFVPADLRGRAYDDTPLPIGRGQTISQPYIVARMSELLALRGAERVLEIGAGCGYQSAVLAALAGQVCALELEGDLVLMAQEHLRCLGVANVDLRQGDGFVPWPEGGSFHGILCACAPLGLPPSLPFQLTPGGNLVLPLEAPDGKQVLQRLHREADGSLHKFMEGAVRFVPMRPPSFS